MRARASSLWRSGGRRCCWGWVSIFGEGVTGMDMEMEVKADALEGAFDAVLAAEAVDELKASVAALKTQVDAQAVAASRLPLDGATAAADPARAAFVERYLRRGVDSSEVRRVGKWC